MVRRGVISFLAAIAGMTSTNGFAESPPIRRQFNPDSPIGVRNANAPLELRQLEFLIGDWKAAVVLHQPNGDVSYEARWRNIWIVDGYAIMQEWRDPYSTGAELRTYNSKTGRWEGRNYYAGWDTWTESSGAFVDGEFVIDTKTIGPEGPRLSRERYFDIQPGSFRMAATHSTDGGKTWSAPTYEMACARLFE